MFFIDSALILLYNLQGDKNMQDIGTLSYLFDFYCKLLTEKQRDIFELYYFQDLSLGEIADYYNISRQAVYDVIKRTEILLYDYEEKLKLYESFLFKKNKLNDMRNLLLSLNIKHDDINKVISGIDELIDFDINN